MQAEDNMDGDNRIGIDSNSNSGNENQKSCPTLDTLFKKAIKSIPCKLKTDRNDISEFLKMSEEFFNTNRPDRCNEGWLRDLYQRETKTMESSSNNDQQQQGQNKMLLTDGEWNYALKMSILLQNLPGKNYQEFNQGYLAFAWGWQTSDRTLSDMRQNVYDAIEDDDIMDLGASIQDGSFLNWDVVKLMNEGHLYRPREKRAKKKYTRYVNSVDTRTNKYAGESVYVMRDACSKFEELGSVWARLKELEANEAAEPFGDNTTGLPEKFLHTKGRYADHSANDHLDANTKNSKDKRTASLDHSEFSIPVTQRTDYTPELKTLRDVILKHGMTECAIAACQGILDGCYNLKDESLQNNMVKNKQFLYTLAEGLVHEQKLGNNRFITYFKDHKDKKVVGNYVAIGNLCGESFFFLCIPRRRNTCRSKDHGYEIRGYDPESTKAYDDWKDSLNKEELDSVNNFEKKFIDNCKGDYTKKEWETIDISIKVVWMKEGDIITFPATACRHGTLIPIQDVLRKIFILHQMLDR